MTYQKQEVIQRIEALEGKVGGSDSDMNTAKANILALQNEVDKDFDKQVLSFPQNTLITSLDLPITAPLDLNIPSPDILINLLGEDGNFEKNNVTNSTLGRGWSLSSTMGGATARFSTWYWAKYGTRSQYLHTLSGSNQYIARKLTQTIENSTTYLLIATGMAEKLSGSATETIQFAFGYYENGSPVGSYKTITTAEGTKTIFHKFTTSATAKSNNPEIRIGNSFGIATYANTYDLYMDGVALYNLGQYGYSTKTETELSNLFEYVDNMQPVMNPMIISRNENLVTNGNCEFGGSYWIAMDGISLSVDIGPVSGKKKFKLYSTIDNKFILQTIRVKPNTDYYINADITGDAAPDLQVLDLNINPIHTGIGTFNTGNNTAIYISLYIATKSTKYIGEISLREGTLPSAAYIQSNGSSSIITTELRKIPGNNTIYDNLSFIDNRAVKIKRIEKIVLNGNEAWTNLGSTYSNIYRMEIANWASIRGAMQGSNVSAIGMETYVSTPLATNGEGSTIPQLDTRIGYGSLYYPHTTNETLDTIGFSIGGSSQDSKLYLKLPKDIIDIMVTDSDGGMTASDAFKAYLKYTPITIYYAVVEPVLDYPRTLGEVIGYEGINTIEVKTGIITEELIMTSIATNGSAITMATKYDREYNKSFIPEFSAFNLLKLKDGNTFDIPHDYFSERLDQQPLVEKFYMYSPADATPSRSQFSVANWDTSATYLLRYTAQLGKYSHSKLTVNINYSKNFKGVYKDLARSAGRISANVTGVENALQGHKTGTAHRQSKNASLIGLYSNPEGNSNTTVGAYTHAEGYGNYVSGMYSHIMGIGNVDISTSSNVEGVMNFVCTGTNYHIVSANDETHEITLNTAQGLIAGTSNLKMHLVGSGYGDNGPTLRTLTNLRILNVNGATVKLDTSALLVNRYTEAYVTDDEYTPTADNAMNDPTSFSSNHIEGGLNFVSALLAHVEGRYNIVNAAGAHVEGGNNNIHKDASGSHVEGGLNIMYAKMSHLEGRGNIQFSEIPYIPIVKVDNVAKTVTLARTPNFTTSNFVTLFTTGTSPAPALCDIAVTQISGKVVTLNTSRSLTSYNAIYGISRPSSSLISHLEGAYNFATNDINHTEGNNNTNFGHKAHMEGSDNYIHNYAQYTHAEGFGNYAGNLAHVEGFGNVGAYTGNVIYKILAFDDTTKTITVDKTGIMANGFINIKIRDAKPKLNVPVKTVTGTYPYVITLDITDTIDSTWQYVFLESSSTSNFSNVHAEGYNNIVVGDSSHIEGYDNFVESAYTHAEGFRNLAINGANTSHIEGSMNITTNEYTHVEGISNLEKSNGSHMEGSFNLTVTGAYYQIASYNNTTKVITLTTAPSNLNTGDYLSIKIGSTISLNNIMISGISGADITLNTAESLVGCDYAVKFSPTTGSNHTEGINNLVVGKYNHMEGGTNKIFGDNNHMEGYANIGNGNYFHIEGSMARAYANYTHVEGYNCTASALYSHAQNLGTTATGEAQTVIGKYNVLDTTSLFIIGNGTSSAARSNAFKVDQNGNLEISGSVKTKTYTATIGTSWTGSTAPYTQTITIAGLAEGSPKIGPVFSGDNATKILQKKAWILIDDIEVTAGQIVVTCFSKKPATAIPIQIV